VAYWLPNERYERILGGPRQRPRPGRIQARRVGSMLFSCQLATDEDHDRHSSFLCTGSSDALLRHRQLPSTDNYCREQRAVRETVKRLVLASVAIAHDESRNSALKDVGVDERSCCVTDLVVQEWH
jgi:hypothetical protein